MLPKALSADYGQREPKLMHINFADCCRPLRTAVRRRLSAVADHPAPTAMNLSGILVTADTTALPTVLATLATLPGIEVRDVDTTLGRIVVVQEAADVGAEVDGFTRIRALPHVINADLVCHYFDDSDAEATPAS